MQQHSSAQVVPGFQVSVPALIASALMALTAIALLSQLSHGESLLVTFVPAIVIAWLVLAHLQDRAAALPRADAVSPVFVAALAWQLLHFAEEFATGFWHAFPTLYGGDPYSQSEFVAFNMGAYALFSVAFVVAITRGITPLYLPPLFFAVYGGIGNAIAHVTWTVLHGAYFPGLVTGIGHAVVGPILLRTLWPAGGWKGVVTVVLAVIVIQVPLLIMTAHVHSV